VRTALRLSDLSPSRRALVRLCQDLNHGQIQTLVVRDADPNFFPPPVVLRDVKLDSHDESRPEAALPDFEIRDEIHRLMAHLDELQNGVVDVIYVRAGLPRRLIMRTQIKDENR
jgi:hypothetical protein